MKIYPKDDEIVKEFFKTHKYDEARKFLIARETDYLREKDSGIKSTYYGYLAKSHSMMGDYDQADMVFETALGFLPHNYHVKLEKAAHHMRQGKIYKANDIFIDLYQNSSITGKSYNKLLNSLMGRFFKLQGNYRQSQICYGEALKEGVYHQDGLGKEFAEKMMAQEKAQGPAPLAGTLEYARHLHEDSENIGLSLSLAIPFLRNRLQDIKNIDQRIACYIALAQYSADNDMNAALNFNTNAYGLDQNNIPTLENGLVLLARAKATTTLRAQFKRDLSIISQSPATMISLAEKFFEESETHDLARILCEQVTEDPKSSWGARSRANYVLHQIGQKEEARAFE